MKQIFGFLMIAWVVFLQIMGQDIGMAGIASLLGALCFFILKEKYFNKLYASILFFIAAIVLAQYFGPFIVLAAIPLLDFAYVRNYYLAIPGLAIASYWMVDTGRYAYLILPVLALFIGHALGIKDRNELASIRVLDNERRLRYDLEQARNELIRSRGEIEGLTEARERNRIAHQLHDSIGHAIASVLMQLQAAAKVNGKDAEKTGAILKRCTEKLSDTLALTRDTVYNIRPTVKTGLGAVERLIGEFTYCPITFSHSGDFNRISAVNMQIIEASIREALTNAARHSHASGIEINIDARRRHIRLYYKDNGVGCADIREGLGLMGMRDRVKNAGGTISIDGSDGFLIVCNLPQNQEEGEYA